MMASSSRQLNGEQDWVLAKQGLKLLINNRGKEAEALFLKYPDSLIMFSGYSYAVFMDALMSFEEDKLTKAITTLKEVERRCNSHGWFKLVKNKVFGAPEEEPPLTETLETQIILADSQVCLAILVFLQQDISGYLKAGWVLRKAWKVYQSTYTDILNLYNSQIGQLNLPDPSIASTSSHTLNIEREILTADESSPHISSNNGYILSNPFPHSQSVEFNAALEQKSPSLNFSNPTPRFYAKNSMKKSISVNEALSKSHGWGSRLNNISTSLSLNYFTSVFGFFSTDRLRVSDRAMNKKTIIRLMNAVAFGYGLFQLGVSLLPPTLFRLTSFLGLSGNRMHGLACLMYARLGVDMRAPLATLSLLWYHCIVRPFYALDGNNVSAGAHVANHLIRETEDEYGESAIFLFFRGRLCRLNSDIPGALYAFQASVNNATQREIKLLALHEVGWCYLIQLDYYNAESNFAYLSSFSRWSRPFYCYITSICKGSRGGFNEYSVLEDLIGNIKASSRANQLDEFLTKRVACFPGREHLTNCPSKYWRIFVYEMLYLWNCLASCTKESIVQILADCDLESAREEPMRGISKLIQGSCFLILGQTYEAKSALRQAIDMRLENQISKGNTKDAHVLAFAQYELGAMMLTNPETKEEGRRLLQETLLIKDYDFEERLTVRITSILKHS